MRRLTLTTILLSVVVSSCTSAPPPAAETEPIDSTTAVLAFHQDGRVRFANAAGRVWGDIPAKAPAWAWSADGKHLAWLDENRLHVVDPITGEEESQPCPCNGLGRLGNRFATLSSDGAALLLFTPSARTERVALPRTMPSARVITGGEDRVAIAEPIPEEIADYRGQSALAEVDANGTVTPMIEGKSAVSVWTGASSPDGEQIATIESPSGGACNTVPGVFTLGYGELNPVRERAVPSDGPFAEAVLDEVRLITGMRWAGEDLVVALGPNPSCQRLLASRYLAYRLAGGEWEHLASGVSDLGFGADGRSYAIELPDDVAAEDANPYGTLVITAADRARAKVSDRVESFLLTPAEEAAGVVEPRPRPESKTLPETTDRGEPLDTEYRDLARRIAEALEANDVAVLESLCGRCDTSTRQQITTPDGREALRLLLRTHPAVDDETATFPGVAVNRCIDAPKTEEACTTEQLHDIGLLGLESDSDFHITPGRTYLATSSTRLALDEGGAAFWAGRSTSADRYRNEPAYPDAPESYFFTTPDGEYQCGFTPEMAGCHGATQPIPPRPDSCGEGPSWGGGMFVDPTGNTGFLCTGGVIFWPSDGSQPGAEDRLTPGQTISAMNYSCTAGEHEMRCTHDATGHGFRMAPDSNEQF